MAKFDWIPYLEGKYLTYYQWFAVLGCTAALAISFINFFLYLILCRIDRKGKTAPFGVVPQNNKIIDKLKDITFFLTFLFLSIIPMICSALDVIWLIEGIIGMMAILILSIFLDNGRKNWDQQFDRYEYLSSSVA